MKLHFTLRCLGYPGIDGELQNYYYSYDNMINICCFPIRGVSETDTSWNRAKDCIGFVLTNDLSAILDSEFWVIYELKKL